MARLKHFAYHENSTSLLMRELSTLLATMERDMAGMPAARLYGHRLRQARLIVSELRARGEQLRLTIE